MGIKDHFSLAESITAGITAGFGSGFGGPVIGEKTIMTMVRMGMVNVSEQLTEMAIGIRQQFDIAGVVLAMGSAGLSSQIKIADPLERRLVADVEVAAMSSIVRGRFDVENLATQLITDAAAVGMQQQTKPISDDYHQSQKASGGVGQITQTTIDQQWDAHLINDAEFTADTSLPSVTFDVNNSYVAEQLGQRVGEEVSHFYHPTPPPRNPNGFWQRFEQRYESVFEHRALIAEGRAAANSEVMNESLGHAAANQQNYLDLGYADSNAQYGAGLIAMSEIPATKTIRLGIQATRFLAENKWGFFERNIAEKPLNLVENEASNHINALRLQRSFTIEQAKSIFDETGGLLPEVIQSSTRLKINPFRNTELNEALSGRAGNLSDWRKYVTESIPSPSGNFRMHFYHNSVTNDVYYDMDYKAVFNHEGSWKLPLSPNFEFEPPRFTF
jgi:hypothetical protein